MGGTKKRYLEPGGELKRVLDQAQKSVTANVRGSKQTVAADFTGAPKNFYRYFNRQTNSVGAHSVLNVNSVSVDCIEINNRSKTNLIDFLCGAQLAKVIIQKSHFSGPFLHLQFQTFIFSALARLEAPVILSEIKIELAFALDKARVAPWRLMRVPRDQLKSILLAARLK